MSNILGGSQRGTAYIGTSANQPPNWNFELRDPTQYDSLNYSLGDLWLNMTDRGVWVLVSLAGDANSKGELATWVKFSGGFGSVTRLKADDLNFANPNSGTINVFGDTRVTTTADNVNTLTINLSGTVASSYPTDFNGPAIPAAGVLNIFGAASTDPEAVALVFRQNIHTNGTGNTVQVKLNDTISWPNTTANGRQGILYLGGATTANRFIHNYGSGNTFIGQASGNLTLNIVSSNHNTAVGFNSMQGLTTAEGCVAVGSASLQACTTGILNTAIGGSALAAVTTGAKNVGIGVAAAQSLTTGDQNTIVGEFAGSNYTGAESHNTIVGAGISGLIGETGIVRIGSQVGSTNTNNTFVGFQAGNSTYTLGSAISNTIIGGSTGNSITTGTLNVMLGASIGTTVTSGTRLVLIGNGAGNSLTGNETDSIFILNGGAAGLSNTMSIGQGTGTGTNQLNKVFLSGVAGITTIINDAIPVLISASTGQLGTISSSRRFKENIENMDSSTDDILNLRPVVFNYKKHPEHKRSYGLIAEEVATTFPDLVVYDQEGLPETVKYHELIPMLLNELQKLNERVKVLERT